MGREVREARQTPAVVRDLDLVKYPDLFADNEIAVKQP